MPSINHALLPPSSPPVIAGARQHPWVNTKAAWLSHKSPLQSNLTQGQSTLPDEMEVPRWLMPVYAICCGGRHRKDSTHLLPRLDYRGEGLGPDLEGGLGTTSLYTPSLPSTGGDLALDPSCLTGMDAKGANAFATQAGRARRLTRVTKLFPAMD